MLIMVLFIIFNRSPQSEPVDFSGQSRALGYGLIGTNIASTPYSRESTPDSGGSHYMENYRDPNSEFLISKT